nr:DUF4160 domain-containing protein [Sulfurimonas sp. SAG-AH-194-I05]
MYFKEKYKEHNASMNIKTIGVMEGRVPSKVLGHVVQWEEDHQDELLENWEDIKTTGGYHKINPLV